MATSFTLATLKTAIKNHVEDQGTDFNDNIETLIKLGEDMVLKDLPLTIFDGRANVSIAAGTQATNKPTGCIVAHEISYISTTTFILYPRRYSFLRAAVPNTTQAAPRWFADDYSESQFWIAPSPNLTVTGEALMTKRPDSLVTDTTGTWLSENVGDVLLDACLIRADLFNVADERIATWRVEYEKKLATARLAFAHLLRRPYLGGA